MNLNSNSIHRINLPENSVIFCLQKQLLDGQSLVKTNIKRCDITCQVELDIGTGETRNDVEFTSTLDQKDQVFY